MFDERSIILWHTDPSEVRDPRLLSVYSTFLSSEEVERQRRYVFAKHRHAYLVTRVLVRTVLSRYADVEPADWRFQPNEFGRPEIVGPDDAPPLRFSVSRTDGMIVCAVTNEQSLGVDVENTTLRGESLGIAESYFAPSEVADLRDLPPDRQRDRFFELWTLKESYVKARGLGLSIPLDEFAFELSRCDEIRISFGPEIADDSTAWQFNQYRPTPVHKLAVAIRRGNEPDYAIELKRTVPLVT